MPQKERAEFVLWLGYCSNLLNGDYTNKFYIYSSKKLDV